MSEKPSIADLREATGISQSYASMILNGSRRPPWSLAIRIYQSTGWRHEMLADLTDEQIEILTKVDPWHPTGTQAA